MGKGLFYLVAEALPNEDDFELDSRWIESIINQPLTDNYYSNKYFLSKGSRLGRALQEKGYFIAESDIDKIHRTFKIHVVRNGKSYDKLYKKEKQKRITKDGIYNLHLKRDKVEIDKNGYVIINKKNANAIRDMVSSHVHYSYVKFVKKPLENTKPAENEQPSIEDVILRLVIIDNIDGTNLSRSFGSGGYELIANSIIDEKLEDKIRNGEDIDNEIFKKIAQRESIAENSEDKIRLFSVVSKYISRTAQYVYHLDDKYPIYDEVLRKHLHFYIPSMTYKVVGKYRDNLDYKSYVSGIKEYLIRLNQDLTKKGEENVTFSDFDQIVWFSYKDANAEQKYK